TPKLYQGHTVLEVQFQEPTLVSSEEPATRMRSMFLASQEALRTIEQNLVNRTLLARVVRAEGLADDGGSALLGRSVTPDSSEAAVAEYKEKTPDALQLGGGAAATGSQSGAGSSGGRGGLVEDKLQELTSKLTAAKADRIRIQNELKQIDGIGDNVDALLAIPSIAAAQTVNDRRRDVSQLESNVGALAQRYKDKHPKMVSARA